MNAAQVANAFIELGGTFLRRPAELAASMEGITGLLFDWDGVFNAGDKSAETGSSFSEADSMGTNMLRFALWRRIGRLPVSAIVTGEQNPAALAFARREHFDAVYLGIRDKPQVLRHLLDGRGLRADQIVYLFDDINDLGVAQECGLRLLVRRSASPLLRAYVTERNLCDYVTAHEGGHGAVREACELLLGLSGDFEAVLASRRLLDESYGAYFSQRQALSGRVFLEREGAVVPR